MSRPLLLELTELQGAAFTTLQLHATATFLTLSLVEGVITRRPATDPPRELVTDLFYWLFTPMFRMGSRALVAGMLLLLAAALGWNAGPSLLHGWGPLARQPMWLMVFELLLLTDFMSYWSHRLFHTVGLFWRFHAIHHSATTIRWSTTARVHPINEFVNYGVGLAPCCLLGFPLEALFWITPVLSWYAVSAHTQWNPKFGPLGRVFASPRMHQWHHTHSDEGGNKNFGNLFSLWDRMFGTYYFPDRVPTVFGLDLEPLPENYLHQFLSPFRKQPSGTVEGRSVETLHAPQTVEHSANSSHPRENAAARSSASTRASTS
jgi:sterol desaturase/sphingolipid hydroxylase (fatty acid hydroxylase superfamily)